MMLCRFRRWAALLAISLPAQLGFPAAAAECDAKPAIEYELGPKRDVDALYPMIRTASMSDYDYSMAVAASIQYYLQNSLNRDLIDACYLKVTPDGDSGYKVYFRSSDSRAAGYGATQSAFLSHGMLGLQGVVNCQRDQSCWEPIVKNGSGTQMKCSGPWQFYLPLGLPMISQKMVMLLHYPPYSAIQQSDYLNNATLNRWQRLLLAVGVPQNEWTRYTTTTDIFPIAAPGNGQTGCFPTAAAMNFFGSGGTGYIPKMLGSLVIAPEKPAANATVPVIVYGAEAIGYWNAAYPSAPVAVLKAGSVKLGGERSAKVTPYLGANHPIAAVYQDCSSKPGILTMEKQDLTTACFAKTMGDNPGADPVKVESQCQARYFADKPLPNYASQICVNAVIDKSPQFNQWTPARAKLWCAAHHDVACPLPNYAE